MKMALTQVKKQLVSLLYLIAKTLCSFISVRSEVQNNIPICIGFHDQDPIMRTGRD